MTARIIDQDQGALGWRRWFRPEAPAGTAMVRQIGGLSPEDADERSVLALLRRQLLLNQTARESRFLRRGAL